MSNDEFPDTFIDEFDVVEKDGDLEVCSCHGALIVCTIRCLHQQ